MTVTALHSPALAGMLDGAREAIRGAGSVSVATVGTDELGASITALAELESQVVALRMSLSAEADARRVADETAHTGTDAWLAQLTGDTRAALAGGLRIARLLQEKYDATREAFAAGRLRLPQVRVIVDAAEQAPPEATPAQVRAAEELLVARATGDATRSGRPTDARRLRQVARRMFDPVDRELADRHEAILLGRETRTAEAETFLALHDNGNGTFSGRFLIPELHGNLLRHALERLTAPRRLSRDRAGAQVTDPTALGTGYGAHIYETRGAAFLELLEHLPATGHGPNGTELLVTIDLDALTSGLGTARLDTGVRITAGDARRLACEAGLVPAVLGGGPSRSTSGGGAGCTTATSVGRSRWCTTPARSPGASDRSPGARSTTSTPGRRAVAPTSTGRFPPAATTTVASTTRGGTSAGAATASGPSTGGRRGAVAPVLPRRDERLARVRRARN